MSEELNERGRRILEAIIEDHIISAEPVGSRAVTRRHPFGLSPATVRNVMADLEEMGYLVSPHTSAGRVPTDKGYRFYVDSLLQVGPLSELERQRIEKYYRLEGLRVEERLREAGKVLSAISHYTGLVMAPRFTSTVFRHIEFLKLSQGRILVVFVSQSGLVQNKIIEYHEEISQAELEQITNYLNRTLTGLSIQEVKARIFKEMAEEKALYDKLLKRALQLSQEALNEEMGGQLFIEGATNILEQPEFADVERMKRLFRTFEQKGVLMDLLDRSQRAKGVQIFIGSETENSIIEGCSLITATYSSSRGAIGALGVIGPTRMPYSMVIPIVDYTARLVSQVLELESE
ncbi:heat-inducible transcription repressor HrcA [Desulfuromonas versatilis]|uniref:Heat-inducible transcription repressor HrcA n=1 Tax=Desulfuromonas versatilis TaxID=2802975 RepID=A0ABN6E3Q5_9BACT|nr:heat-inducible transcriptional repressor HrcA [Desulfuromonas versatilis]BCR06978.1 heat-inducible transcription repressor HrcA [Desulfuromonas versatilis]